MNQSRKSRGAFFYQNKKVTCKAIRLTCNVAKALTREQIRNETLKKFLATMLSR